MAIVGTGLSTKGIKGEFFHTFEASAKQTHFADLATRLQSTTAKETYKFLGTVPPMREWGTGRLARGMYAESYDIENLKYEVTLEVDRDEVEDDQLGQIMIRVREMAQRAATHKDYLIAQLLIHGATAGYNSYDGVPFFGATHESGKSGAQDNDLTGAIVDKDAPTAAELRTALTAAIVALLGFKDDQAEPMSLSATGLVMIVPPSMLIPASEAVNATLTSSGGTNILSGAARIIAFPWLTDTDTWYLAKTDVAVRPFIFQDRKPVEFTALEQDSDEGFRREKFLYGVRARYRMTYGYWQYALRYVFTTA
jgi:phage major head subunit gpT-like protein